MSLLAAAISAFLRSLGPMIPTRTTNLAHALDAKGQREAGLAERKEPNASNPILLTLTKPVLDLPAEPGLIAIAG